MRDKAGQTLRFAVVGSATGAIYYLLTTILNRCLSLDLLVSSVIAFLIAVTFQYLSHALFTYRTIAADVTQGIKFAAVVMSGLVASVFIVSLGRKAGLPQELLLFAVIVVTPVVNWLGFTFWVFIAQGPRRNA